MEDSNKFAKLHQQFLCCYPINKMAWSTLKLPMELEEQRALIAATCGHELNQFFPVRRSYQEAFVKRLLQLLKDHEDLHDDIFDSMCGQLAKASLDDAVSDGTSSSTTTSSYAYKHYVLQPGQHITLRESNSFVSEGTTGLCTWEAALALADYLLQHANLLAGKHVLELGAGAGLLGILLKHRSLQLQVGQVLLTDGSAPCVQLMRHNIALNFKDVDDVVATPQCAELRWNRVAQFEWSKYAIPDLLLAADVVYDETQFEWLLQALDYIFDLAQNRCQMLLASTVRNVDTLHKFMVKLEEHHYQVTPCANVSACASHFCRDHTAAVQIVCIKR
ncbi:protein-lysine N-methyltransferase EEF2KMT [Drosophila sulfurigaster albostrigata]|uniref:protein-lysine N-methyltransferase EEF2KMT n=1 Tax=Drosophila sulfurigaster albostrigata TaxID=89887 RepID=UPI002D21B35A|nr:protein-lysine N-methyltransferase EEF2KMT [Drosophila sulfurigaster albostrigata]